MAIKGGSVGYSKTRWSQESAFAKIEQDISTRGDERLAPNPTHRNYKSGSFPTRAAGGRAGGREGVPSASSYRLPFWYIWASAGSGSGSGSSCRSRLRFTWSISLKGRVCVYVWACVGGCVWEGGGGTSGTKYQVPRCQSVRHAGPNPNRGEQINRAAPASIHHR